MGLWPIHFLISEGLGKLSVRPGYQEEPLSFDCDPPASLAAEGSAGFPVTGVRGYWISPSEDKQMSSLMWWLWLAHQQLRPPRDTLKANAGGIFTGFSIFTDGPCLASRPVESETDAGSLCPHTRKPLSLKYLPVSSQGKEVHSTCSCNRSSRYYVDAESSNYLWKYKIMNK